MSIGKHTYVASKYIFIAIAVYVIYSLDYIWGVTIVLLLAAFEILLYIYTLGEKKQRG